MSVGSIPWLRSFSFQFTFATDFTHKSVHSTLSSLSFCFGTLFILDKDEELSPSDGEDQYNFGGKRRYSGDESDPQSFLPSDKTQRRPDSTTRGVLTEQAARNHQERRLENARNMANTRGNGGTGGAKGSKTGKRKNSTGGSTKKGAKQRRQEEKRRQTQHQSDSESSKSEDEEVLQPELTPAQATIRKQQDELDRYKAENQQLRAKKSRRGGPNLLTSIPFTEKLIKKVWKYTEHEIWRDVKFLANAKELLDVCEEIMTQIPEFQALVQDDADNKQEHIEAFCEIYGKKTICKAINEKRTNVQSALKKAYEKRYPNEKMPTLTELKAVISREGLEYIEEPAEDDPEGAEVHLQIAENKKNREWFRWYWTCLLPGVAGKQYWGYTIRNYVTITGGRHPDDPKKKYITSSDEAMVLAIYENMGQRFPYTAQCKKNGEKVDEQHERYQSKWTDNAAGQCEWGGWNLKGRERYIVLRNSIKSKRKKAHVLPLEKLILKEIQAENNIKTGKGTKKGRVAKDFEGKDEAMASFLGQDSDEDDTVCGASDVDEVDDTYRVPRKST